MTRSRLSTRVLVVMLVALVWVPVGLAQEKAEKLGTVHFPISCSPAAQQQFERAVALLHSFWYEEAVTAFTRITETDAACAMGYWGIAMSLWHPLWQPPSEQELKKGWEAAEKAKALGGKTSRESDYIAAIHSFYRDREKLDHPTRAMAYEQAMEQVHLRYPDDREAAVFYALALDATAMPTDKMYANQLKAAVLLEKVFAEQPNHPGVAHYLIHSYDYPALANRGLTAAREYAKIAPSAPHALHMPSHLFTRLGLWQESIRSNLASWRSGKEYFRQIAKEATWDQDLHAMDYLAYAHLQGAQDGEAMTVLNELAAIRKVEPESFVAAYAFAAIPARLAVERHRWAEAASLAVAPSTFPWNRYPWAEAITVFARALGAARGGDPAAARRDLERLQALRNDLEQAKSTYWAGQVEIQRRAAAAWLAKAEGKNEEALQLMRSAADLESATEKHPVTPGSIVPARELLGELLLEFNQSAQALSEFERSLRAEPNRFNGLYGAARAARLSGDRGKAKTFYNELIALCSQADTERAELVEAKTFVATP